MLPLLPALILLLLQGPAASQRMAWNGQLPGALDALHRQMANSDGKVKTSDESVLASLLAATSGEDVSRALAQLFALALPEPGVQFERTFESACTNKGPRFEPPGPLQDGFLSCRRSRDGPLSIA